MSWVFIVRARNAATCLEIWDQGLDPRTSGSLDLEGLARQWPVLLPCAHVPDLTDFHHGHKNSFQQQRRVLGVDPYGVQGSRRRRRPEPAPPRSLSCAPESLAASASPPLSAPPLPEEGDPSSDPAANLRRALSSRDDASELSPSAGPPAAPKPPASPLRTELVLLELSPAVVEEPVAPPADAPSPPEPKASSPPNLPARAEPAERKGV